MGNGVSSMLASKLEFFCSNQMEVQAEERAAEAQKERKLRERNEQYSRQLEEELEGLKVSVPTNTAEHEPVRLRSLCASLEENTLAQKLQAAVCLVCANLYKEIQYSHEGSGGSGFPLPPEAYLSSEQWLMASEIRSVLIGPSTLLSPYFTYLHLTPPPLHFSPSPHHPGEAGRLLCWPGLSGPDPGGGPPAGGPGEEDGPVRGGVGAQGGAARHRAEGPAQGAAGRRGPTPGAAERDPDAQRQAGQDSP